MFCAPGIKGNGRSCLDRPALMRIADTHNRKYPLKKISYDSKTTDSQLWEKIRDTFANVCGNQEWCWLDQKMLKEEKVLHKYYKPPQPETKTKWLSTSDITDVLRQFERIYQDFAFMGTVPIDFDHVIEEYSRMNLCAFQKAEGLPLSNGTNPYRGRIINKVGFVFNLDPHYKKGSHWVSMFMDLSVKKPYIGYFDSYGYCPPPKEITQLMDRIKEQAKKCLGVDLIKKCNTIRHQRKGTECGTYSLYFIYNSLLGKTFEQITENIILDDDVNMYRDFFFRPSLRQSEDQIDL